MSNKKIDMRLYKNIGEMLKERRESLGISLDTLSERIGGKKTKSTLKRYEDGVSRISIDTLHLLSPVLGFDPQTLVTMASENTDFVFQYDDDLDSISDDYDEVNSQLDSYDNLYGNHKENLAYFADNPELLELYKQIHNSQSLQLLFDNVRDLTPQDLELVLNIIKQIRKDRGLD